MEFVVHLEHTTHTVRFDSGRVLVDGKEVQLDLSPPVSGTPIRSVRHEGRSLRVLPARSSGTDGAKWTLDVEGERVHVEVLDRGQEAIRVAKMASGRATGPRPLKAPMPGLIVRVEVAPGDWVRAGQGLVIVEAMKMENELKAETDGRVKSVQATAGQAVEKDSILVEFETPESDA